MFTFYGTNNDTFCVCQGCGTCYHIQGECLPPCGFKVVASIPEDAEPVDSILCFDLELPECCGEVL